MRSTRKCGRSSKTSDPYKDCIFKLNLLQIVKVVIIVRDHPRR